MIRRPIQGQPGSVDRPDEGRARPFQFPSVHLTMWQKKVHYLKSPNHSPQCKKLMEEKVGRNINKSGRACAKAISRIAKEMWCKICLPK